MDKIYKLADKVISYAGYFLLSAFTTLFAVLTAIAIIKTIVEKDIFNLVGVAGCALITWSLHSLRKEMMS